MDVRVLFWRSLRDTCALAAICAFLMVVVVGSTSSMDSSTSSCVSSSSPTHMLSNKRSSGGMSPMLQPKRECSMLNAQSSVRIFPWGNFVLFFPLFFP